MTNLIRIERDDEDDPKRIARDGEVFYFGMSFMDSVQRAVAASGTRFGDGIIAAARCEAAYRAYDERVSNSWRDSRHETAAPGGAPAPTSPSGAALPAGSPAPLTQSDRPAPSSKAAYANYDARLSAAWKTQPL